MASLALPVLTLAVGFAFLTQQTYTVERCFRSGAMSGCERPVLPFSFEAVPSLVLPALIVVLFAAVQLVVARTSSRDGLVVAATAAAAAAGLIVPVGGLVLLIPLALGLATALARLGQPIRRATLDIALTAGICLVGAVAAYGVLVGAMYLRGGFLGGSAPLMAIYVAYTGVVGIGLGVALAARGGTAVPLARGMAVAGTAAGVAGALALLLVPAVSGRGIIVAGVPLLAGLGISTGTLGARWSFGMSWAASFSLAFAVAFVFAAFLGLSMLLLFGFSGPQALMPPLPAVPHLPGTSTN